jgi:RNA polymerase sigma factor (sigma-70 family)
MPTLRRVVLAEAVKERTDGQLLSAFIANRDGDAFAGLVRRHGPMILGVCRRITGDQTSAEDAFQAVFLVLARRAATIRPREQVGNWLYGVAYRTALKARAVLARRRSREKQVHVMPEPPVNSPAVWFDVQPVIDEELARLPDKLRLPIILCDLEGRTQREVARQLRVPAATLATRLAAARRTLAQRLTRRGVMLSGGVLAGLLTANAAVAAVSHRLVDGLARAAEAAAHGAVATSLVSPHAIQLSEGVIRMMLLSKLKATAVAALTAVALTCGLGLGLVPAVAGDEPGPVVGQPAAAPQTQAPRPAEREKRPALAIVLNERNFDVTETDEIFLRRLLLDLRGTMPTPLETHFFVADSDADKRAKVIAWISADDAVAARVAKKLGVPVEKIRIVRLSTAQEGQPLTVAIISDGDTKEQSLYSVVRRQRLVGPASEATARFLEVDCSGQANLHVWRRQNINRIDNDSVHREGVTLLGRLAVTPTNDAAGQAPSLLFQSIANDNPVQTEAQVQVVLQSELRPSDDITWLDSLSNFLVGSSFTMDSDSEFLRRVLRDARGSAPTTLEDKYFCQDKDPQKREKLLNDLLKDPTVAKKLGEEWKKRMLQSPQAETTFAPLHWKLRGRIVPNTAQGTYLMFAPTLTPQPGDRTALREGVEPAQLNRFEKLVDELFAAKKSDAEMLEAVTLATVSRLPTDAEKGLASTLAAKGADRKAAWLEIARALAGNEGGAKKSESPKGGSTLPKAKP